MLFIDIIETFNIEKKKSYHSVLFRITKLHSYKKKLS